MPFSSSKWIWQSGCDIDDVYVDFRDSFRTRCDSALIRISADSDYALYVNGKFVSSKQYGDFEHYKIYDEIDVSPYLVAFKNEIKVTVYYTSALTSRHSRATAGLIYEVFSGDGELLALSGDHTLVRRNPYYKSGKCISVSSQLGYTFFYDANAEETEYERAVCVEKKCNLFPRPIKKHEIFDVIQPKSIKKLSDTHYLIDLGGESVGFPTLELSSSDIQTIRIAWGEHIRDGGVRYLIDNRNFYFEYTAHEGKNTFTERFLRIGCRYIEVFAQRDIEALHVSVLPEVYPTKPIEISAEREIDKRIYDISLNTLKLCMMEHYVDCPWREQALYAFDSRNQMLCGYYAFSDKNSEYARANLLLISKDVRRDGLLSITYPTGLDLVIPSFSLYYFLSVREYIENTGDITLAKEVSEKLESILSAFLANSDLGLIKSFFGRDKWNFYDWSECLDGTDKLPSAPDLIINCLFVMALDAYEYISAAIGRKFSCVGLADAMRERIRAAFLTSDGRFVHRADNAEHTALGNSLAVLSGVAGERAPALCDEIVCGRVRKSSLSMKIFAYEAMMKTDVDSYSEYILEDIRNTYKDMLDADSDTVWETSLGADDFAGAGSLCHGWSAVPIYVLCRLGAVERKHGK